MLRPGLVLLLLSAVPAAALAQPAPPAPPPPPADGTAAGAGSEVELDEDPPSTTETGEEEDAPKIGGAQQGPAPVAPTARLSAYPLGEIDRPLTLPEFTSELRLEALYFPSPIDAEFGLRARYGITNQIQIGLAYGIGGFYNDGKRDKTRFNTGKAVAIDVAYLATDWIAPRLTIPMYVDPFAIGLELGAPVKFKFGDRMAVVGFEDVVGFKLMGDQFLPDLRREKANETAVDAIVKSNTIQSDGYFRLDGGVVYQLAPDLAATGRFGVTFDDFTGADAATALRALIQFTPIRTLDLVGEVGWDRLDEPKSSLHLSAALVVRI